MRRLESGTTLDNAFATCTNRNLLVMQVPQHAVLAGVLPIRHGFDGHYSNVGNRIVSSPDRPWSRTSFNLMVETSNSARAISTGRRGSSWSDAKRLQHQLSK